MVRFIKGFGACRFSACSELIDFPAYFSWPIYTEITRGETHRPCLTSPNTIEHGRRDRLTHRDTEQHSYATIFAISDSQATSVAGNNFITQWQTDAGAALFCRVERQHGLG